MKLVTRFLGSLFLLLILSSFLGILETKIEAKSITNNYDKIRPIPNYTTWSIKVNRDCYLVLNDLDWGAVLKDNYIEIALSKGMNSLKFTKGKGGETIKKEILVVENRTKQKLEIILPGEVTISKQGERDEARKRSRRRVRSCNDYKEGLTVTTRKRAVVVICVNPEGYVETAEFDRSKSDSLSQETIDLVVKCAKEFQYEAAPDMPTSCGSITLHLGLH